MFKKILFWVLFWFSSPSLAAGEKSLTLVLDWFVNPDHAPILVAEQQGFFQQAGIKLKLVQPSDPMDGPKWVAAGKADLAITYQPQLMMQVGQGLPLVRIGSLVDKPLDCVVALSSSGIKSVKDLKNKTIGYSSGGIDSVMLHAMLDHNNLSLNTVKFINVRFDLVQALLSKNIDAFTGGMRNVEPIQLNELGHPAQMFFPEDNGFPSYDELIFVVQRQNIDDKNFNRFLEALQKGIIYLRAHPLESWNAAIKRYPELNNSMNKTSWFESIKYFSDNPRFLDKKKYQNFAQFLKEQNVIKFVPEISTYAVQLED